MILLNRTLHEYFHFQSYQTVRYFKSLDEFAIGQAGITITGKTPEVQYFRNLDEATTEKLTQKVINEEILNKDVLQAKNPKLFKLLKEEIREVDVLRKISQIRKNALGMDPSEILAAKTEITSLDSGKKKFDAEWKIFSRFKEREILNNLIEKLYSKNKGKFKDKDEVFDLFAESLFTGKLRWARLVNETFGAGTLQKLAKADKNVDELGKFVEGLK